MVRPRKWRRVCTLPEINKFGPVDVAETIKKSVIMTVEEYQTIRLMDLEGLNQEECSNLMGVARSTIQRIYDDARRKIADSLINGKILKIEGGDYKLCSDFEDKENCDYCICGRHKHGKNRRIKG
ncbi:DUF134 domain-containing protein [Clostridium botulinum]|nr:DUF134 domain-containing protein [Clostridium botulinum]